MSIKVDWTGDGIRHSIGQYDRFTQAAIKKDMETDPFLHSVLLDEKSGLYITNAMDERMAVVWQLSNGSELAVMKYTFPMGFRTQDPAKLKGMLVTIIPRDSDGMFTLEGLVPELAKEPQAAPATPKKTEASAFESLAKSIDGT